MSVNVAIGVQDFSTLIENHYFYVDKTAFLKEWWDSGDSVTLITRPRRFGKTLTMSMTEQFFSMEYEGRSDLFEELEIWNDEKYRNLQGTYPVISLSFANIKEPTYELTQKKICDLIAQLYFKFDFITESNALIKEEVNLYKKIMNHMDYVDATLSLNYLSGFLYKYYGKKVIILLDEYDTPMQEAFVDGYWDELVTFTRSLFNSTFKTNPALERGIMTGITRVSKESIFSDLNNLKVVTTTSDEYATTFGFTEPEVFEALGKCGLDSEKSEVKRWYDGYHFGNVDVYCPWDVINHVDRIKDDPMAGPEAYWINTSGNELVKRFIDKAGKTTRNEIERLIAGDMIEKSIRMELTYDEIDNSIDNLWSILFTTGYLTQQGKSERGVYRLVIPNKEIREVYILQIQEWFKDSVLHNREPINQLLKAIKEGDADTVEKDLTKILVNTISIFDTKSRKEEKEIFYHGIVLGLLRCESEWLIQSNIESGDGLVDILIETEDPDAGIIIELKYAQTFHGLSKACENAMRQIKERRYDERLRNEGRNDILAYGIAFCRKRCKVVVKNL